MFRPSPARGRRQRPGSLQTVRQLILGCAVCCLGGAGAFADEVTPLPPADPNELQLRLERQEQELQSLRARLENLERPPSTPVEPTDGEAAAVPVRNASLSAAEFNEVVRRLDVLEQDKKKADAPKSEWVDVSKEKWTVKLGGHVQMDYVTWANADPAITNTENYFSFRRLRLVADGTGYGVFDFRLQMTLEPGQGANDDSTASPDVKDAYLSMNEVPVLGRIRIGNFFVPFSLEQVTNDTNNIFTERSIPTQGVFAADREVGIAFYNSTVDHYITWSGGFFFDDLNDTFKARVNDYQGYRLSGRLTALPYYDEPSNGRYLVHTGIGILHTDDFDDNVRFRTRPQIQRGPIVLDSGGLLADTYTTGNVEAAVVWGPVTLQTEAFISNVNLNNGGNAQANGAYAHLSYFLTGENRIFEKFGQHGAQFGRNQPFTNFFATPGGIGWGAWESKVRWSHLDLNDVDRGQYNDVTAGFNWYWSDRTRVMFDWIHPITSSDAVFGATDSDLLAMRFDFNW
jgi:phosphate-selective porin OprO/OprP